MRAVESKDQDMLNRLTAIQAAAEILDDHEDLSANDRRLFLFVIRSETKRLHRMIEEASA